MSLISQYGLKSSFPNFEIQSFCVTIAASEIELIVIHSIMGDAKQSEIVRKGKKSGKQTLF